MVVVYNPIISCLQATALEGSIISAMHGVPYARARGRKLQQAISSVNLSDNDYTKTFQVSEEVREEARYWQHLAMDHFVDIKTPVPTQVITTDASLDALGVELDGETKSFDVSYLDSRDDISYKELLALKQGLQFFKHKLHDVILWQVDNESARCAINNQGSSGSKAMNDLSLDILTFCQRIGVQILTQRIESEQNIVADALSRGKRVQDWALRQDAADKIFRIFGQPDIDMMATRESSKTERFWGWRKDPDAEGIDSLSPIVSWEGIGFPYVFPPPPLIPKVLDKISQARLKKAIIIAPWWYSKPWFPRLRAMTTHMRRLPLRGCLVKDLSNPDFHIDLFQLKLVAFKVTGSQPSSRITSALLHSEEGGSLFKKKCYRFIPSLDSTFGTKFIGQ